MDKVDIIAHLLEKEGIIIPLPLLKGEMVEKLNKALSSEKAILVSNAFKDFESNLEEYLSFKDIDKLGKMILSLEQKNRNRTSPIIITEDDKKIINFLVENSEFKGKDFLQMSGPMFFISEVVNEIDKSKDILPKLLLISNFMFIFVITYELVLYQVDRRVFYFLSKNKNKFQDNFYKKFVELDRESTEHSTAGKLNEVISKILDIRSENDSIFGESSKPKIIRNKISHTNLFYDSARNVVILGNEEYSMEEFIDQYLKIFSFLIEWIKSSLKIKEDFGGKFKEVVLSDMKECFGKLSHIFLEIERSGVLSKGFMSLVIQWKKERSDKENSKA